tara:strand:+ start:19943 stop:21376 length:1434 start_codon:yes stop_codon:yes gene_type:complete
MDNICIYIFGFIIGVFLLITLLRYNVFYTSNNKDSSDIDIDIDIDNLNIEKFDMQEKILEDYDEEDDNNFVKCNINILNNFKIDRLLKKHYLITLISSYNKGNYNKQTKTWALDNKNMNNKGDNSVKLDVNPEYIHFPLKPTIGGFNINKSTIEIMPKYMKSKLGMNWEEFNETPSNFIEIDEDTNGYYKLKEKLSSGQTKFSSNMIKKFPEIMHNNYITINEKKYKPLINNLENIKKISILFAFKLKEIDNDFGKLLYIGNKNNGNLISINIINSNNVNTNTIDQKCIEDKNCKKIIENIHNSINLHNNYYEQNSISNNEFTKYISEKCEEGEEYIINKNMCEYIKKTYTDEISFHNRLYEKKKYTIQIVIESYTYNIYDVSEDIFNDNYTSISLIIDNNDITFYLNDIIMKFKKRNNNSLVALYPCILNKNKNCDLILYSFALFDDAICEADIGAFKLYNNYYLYGIENEENEEN